MAKVRFTHNYDFKPTQMVTIAYQAGDEKTVTRACAEQAVAAGKAKWVGKAPEDDGEK